MAVTIIKTGPFYNSTESISFSSLRSNFKRTSFGSISASELRRNTSLTNTDPIVPDATENVNVSTSSDWKVSQLRTAIKYYDITQTGTDINLNIATSSYWNSNLNKNIVKRAIISGACGSNLTGTSAAYMTSTAYNLTIDVYGQILGAAGAGGYSIIRNGQDGGAALQIAPSSSNNIVVFVRSSAKIYGGGGGGEYGADGTNGQSGNCINYSYYTLPGCNGCQSCGSNTLVSCDKSGRCACSWGVCSQGYVGTCRVTNVYGVAGGAGGTGGNGANGRGYNNQTNSLVGASGTQGTASSCSGYQANGSPVPTSGTNGENGGNGGDWGQAGGNTNGTGNGGAAGRAIFGSNYSVTGSINSTTIKGSYAAG